MTLNARPNLNGNPPQDFGSCARQLFDAKQQMLAAIAPFVVELTHGRNYQHVPPGDADAARFADKQRVVEMYDALYKLDTLIRDLQAASDAGSKGGQ